MNQLTALLAELGKADTAATPTEEIWIHPLGIPGSVVSIPQFENAVTKPKHVLFIHPDDLPHLCDQLSNMIGKPVHEVNAISGIPVIDKRT